MNSELSELQEALLARMEIVGNRGLYERDPAAHLKGLAEASERVDRLVETLLPKTDPMLRHFLERQSYMKALCWLEENLK